MRRFKLFFAFYKSTLTLSVALAFTVAVIAGIVGFFTFFGITFMTGGWVLSLYYKEISYKNEYLYYRNMGMTKQALVIYCVLLNIVIGLACILYSHA